MRDDIIDMGQERRVSGVFDLGEGRRRVARAFDDLRGLAHRARVDQTVAAAAGDPGGTCSLRQQRTLVRGFEDLQAVDEHPRRGLAAGEQLGARSARISSFA